MRAVRSRKGSLHIGPVGVEDSWRPADLASLPRVGSAHGSAIAQALDEVLSALSEEGDRLITAFELPPGFVEATRAAGFPVDPVPRPEGAGDDVVARTLDRADAIRPHVAGMTLRPYAARPEYEDLASALDLAYTSPTAECATRVNSKTWSNEVVLAQGWAGAAWPVASLAELERRVAQAGSVALLKDPYGVSGQGTLAIRSETAYRSVARHLSRQLDRGKRLELLVQPLFEKQRDISSHWHISPDGAVRSTGLLENDVDGFRYRGSSPVAPESFPEEQFGHIDEAGRILCAELFAAGYFGPVDIDGLIATDGTVVPCLEVNARVSMGTVALALTRHAARLGLHATLEFINVRLDAGVRPFPTLVDRLDDAGLLYRRQGPGVVPLTANTLTRGERGRLVLGVFHPPGDAAHVRREARWPDAARASGPPIPQVLREAIGIACACGIHPEDQRHPCHASPAGDPER
ncbi:hypothetical protein [Streptomyces sp. NPDC047974]|uniref:hypothetical protein n=1 Tax=Streptomyces sp. NPDC047974 TaxID=3154343 RepID=UPI0033F05024